MHEKIITCITCPVGCSITVCADGDKICSISGNACKRGEAYARDEFTHPIRILATSVKVCGADVPLVPVRSSKPVPKELLPDCMTEIKQIAAKAPICRYDVIIHDILGTGADIVATGSAEPTER